MKRVFLFETQESEYLVALTPGREARRGTFTVLLLVQLAGGNERKENGVAPYLPKIDYNFVAYFREESIQTSMVTKVREI